MISFDALLKLFWTFIVGLFFTGCALPQPVTQMTGNMEKVGDALVTMMAEQGVLDKFAANIRGHAKDPGVEAYTSIILASGVRAVGVDGDVNLEGDGTGTQLSADVKAALLQEALTATPERREAIFKILAPG